VTAFSDESFDEPTLLAQVLCRVEYVHIPWGTEPEFARLRPISVESDGEWKAIDDPKYLFGDEGLIFWWKPHTGCKDLLWRLFVSPQPKYDGIQKRDRFQVREGSASPVEELFSCGTTLSDDQLRLLLDEGAQFDKAPLGKVLFRLEGDRCAGPLELSFINGRWSCPDNDIRSRVPVSHFNEGDFRLIRNDGTQHSVLGPRSKLPAHSAYLNAQTPIHVLHGLVKRIRRLDRPTYEALSVTYQTYDAYVDALVKAQLPADQALMERARGERLKLIISGLKSDVSILTDLGNALLEHSEVAKRVEDAVQLEVQRKVDCAAGAIEEKLSELRTTLRDVEHQLASRRQTLVETETRLRAAKEEAQALHGRLAEEFSRQLNEMLTHPVSAIAQNAIFTALATGGQKESSREKNVSVEQREKVTPLVIPQSTELAEFQELRRHFGNRLADCGVSILSAPIVLGSCLSGNVPLVFGPHVDDLMQAFSAVVAGGRMFRVPVSAATYQVQDLFVKQDPLTGRMQRTSGSLGRILEQCRSLDRLVVILLEGVNRAPLESFLSPLLSSVATSGDGEEQAKIPVDSFDGQATDWISWPSNVLLVGSIVEGPSSFPIPRTMLERITLIPTWFGPPLPNAPAADVATTLYELKFATWEAAQANAKKGAVSAESAKHIEALGLPSAISKKGARRFASALEMSLGAPANWIISSALGTQWLPIATLGESKSLRAKLTGELGEEWVKAAAAAASGLIWDGSIGGVGR
jgi:hypothetical protein